MLEERIAEWRSYVRRRQAIHTVDVEELEDHLRSQVADLREAGLDEDEAFLIAVKRIGDLEALSREFAREVLGAPMEAPRPGPRRRRERGRLEPRGVGGGGSGRRRGRGNQGP